MTLITYPGQSGFEPDQEMVEALGEILESRLASPAEASIGVSVARLDPAAVVTFDDAYYRLLGNDLPLLDETAEGSCARARMAMRRRSTSYFRGSMVWNAGWAVQSDALQL